MTAIHLFCLIRVSRRELRLMTNHFRNRHDLLGLFQIRHVHLGAPPLESRSLITHNLPVN